MLLLAVSHAACTEDEPYIRAPAPVEEPAFDYGLYCDARGTLVGEDSVQGSSRLVYDAEVASEEARALIEKALRKKNVETHFHELH
jgi:hypothetical protein